MNNLFQENKRAFILLLILLFVLLVMVYFLFFKPLANDRDQAETQVKQLTESVDLLQTQVDEMDEEEPTFESDVEEKRLERKIPKEPELQEFLLTLQEIELVSESKIIDYDFSYDGTIPERQELLEDEETEDTQEATDETEEETTEEETTEEATEIEELEVELEEGEDEISPILELPGLPEETRLVTVSMELYSPDYEQLQAFLQEIEKQERIMMISYLNFEKPGELELIEMEDESIWANIEVTTFYYES